MLFSTVCISETKHKQLYRKYKKLMWTRQWRWKCSAGLVMYGNKKVNLVDPLNNLCWRSETISKVMEEEKAFPKLETIECCTLWHTNEKLQRLPSRNCQLHKPSTIPSCVRHSHGELVSSELSRNMRLVLDAQRNRVRSLWGF